MQPKEILNKIWTNPQHTAEFSRWLVKRNCIVIHAASLVINNVCFVFLGNSGAGKTTIAKMFINRVVPGNILNDDLIVVQYLKNQIIVYGTPWIGRKTQAEKEFASIVCSKKYISSNTHNMVWLSLCHRKKNILLQELKGPPKMQSILHGLWGNHLFISQNQIDFRSKHVLDSNLTKIDIRLYQRSINISCMLILNIRIWKLGFKKSSRIVDYLIGPRVYFLSKTPILSANEVI